MATGSYLSIITLNVNGMNAPTKRQRLAEWIKKQDLYICCLQETHLKIGYTNRLKVKGWKKIFHANRDQNKAGVTILISDKIDFKTKAVKRDKEGDYIMIKGSIQEEDTTIINIYAPNMMLLFGCLVTKSCTTVYNPMNCSLPGSSVHGISQTRTLEWVAISFSRASSQSRDQTHVSWILLLLSNQGSPLIFQSTL